MESKQGPVSGYDSPIMFSLKYKQYVIVHYS